MQQLNQIMMQLIGSEACDLPIKPIADGVLSETFYERLYKLSKSQDLCHLVGSALAKQKQMPAGEIGAKFEKQMFTAAYRGRGADR